jgi:predicted ATPase
MITKLNVRAYKGLKEFAIEPKNVNLLIGANGTGKTNFADLIEFISLTCRMGLSEAFDRQGGLDEVRTKLPGVGRKLSLHCSLALGPDPNRGIQRADYSFTLSASKELIVNDEELSATVYPRSAGRPTLPEKVKFDRTRPISIRFRRTRGKVDEWTTATLGQSPEVLEDEQNLVLNIYGKVSNFRTIFDYLSSMRVYNIDAFLAKSASDGNDAELERRGENMIAVLKRVIEQERMRQKLLNDLRNAVPYVKDIVPDRILTYTTLKFSEFDSKLDFRAQQMSDGTIRLLGLLTVLRQAVPPPVVVVEEPENALHAYAVKTFLRIAKEVSLREKFPTQIFLTSHSPEVVDGVLAIDNREKAPTQCFVTKRRKGAGTIEPVSGGVMRAIAKNLGRPSDFLREGSFDDMPVQLPLVDSTGQAL